MTKLHVKKGDKVVVITGDQKGQEGEITKVFPKKERVIVGGINMVKKHIKPSSQNPSGSIEEMEASIHISNLKVVK